MNLECGLDEAGRGPLAGPVTAGAVILPDDFSFEILNDSKRLSEKKRDYVETVIKEKACWGIGVVDHEMIDKMNILRASMYAMSVAFDMMMLRLPDWAHAHGISDYEVFAIADGNCVPKINCQNVRCEIKGDAKFKSVMAASIIAKVGRDRIMYTMDSLYPQYGYARHKGYPTPEHKKICRELGPSPIQRLTFKI